ncbi:YesL family protein [Gracilibacillus timonensis]|uniref:YesL family protein n=1 Tax=Gracilibacillus timonensis TaxID=1816696 RepID=UPI0008253CA3|nr:DUF624 domain-containing protein [Gracilibacillus timonensis]
MKGFVNGYYRLANWVTQLAYFNMLWVLFSVAGLGILGFFPATAALFAVIRKWMLEEDIRVFQTFWKYVRKDFIKANILGYLVLAIGYILYIEFQILWSSGQTMYVLASFGVLALVFLYVIMLLFLFPIFSHFNLSMVNYLKWPLVIGIIHPILTVFIVLTLSVSYYVVFMTIPALLFFFGGSITAYFLTWGGFKTFSKYEKVEVETV